MSVNKAIRLIILMLICSTISCRLFDRQNNNRENGSDQETSTNGTNEAESSAGEPNSSDGEIPALTPRGDRIKIKEVYPINQDVLWAIGGRGENFDHVLRSVDRGSSWQIVHSMPDDPEIEGYRYQGTFPTDKTAWITYYQPRNKPIELPILLTTDGGQSWETAAPVPFFGGGNYLSAYLFAFGKQEAWVLTELVTAGAGINYLTAIHSTTDGGESWLSNSLILYEFTGMAYAYGGIGLITEEITGFYTSSPAPAIWYSTDNGFSFERIVLPDPEDSPDLFSLFATCSTNDPYLANTIPYIIISVLMKCYSDDKSTTISYLYTSLDEGKTWETHPVIGDQVFMLSEDHGWAISDILAYTDNAGESWEFIRSIEAGYYNIISLRNGDGGWGVVGDDYRLIHSSDDGRTWQTIDYVVEGDGGG